MSQSIAFNLWLKQRRKALGLTQKDLAQQAGCAEITLRKIEAGDLQPSPPLAASLVRAVGATDADLSGMTGFASPGITPHTPVERWRMPRRPHNLPGQLTPLIGRTQDIAAVRKRLLADDARLITLLGPPGVGKTRLAQAVAEDVLEQFEDGAFFVRLAPISDPTLVASAIAQALDLQMTGSNPPALQLRRYLEEKHLLLVLDNFEQVIEAAALVDDLLRRCQWLHVLVTSRQALRVRGERQVPVLPLALPADVPGAARTTASEVLRYAAVALFEERAQAVQPDFAVNDSNAAPVAELCRRLDGLPLAIELVAARVKLLPPAELLARVHGPWMLSVDGLRDVSARQKTLRGAIGWSYDLLTPAEQTLFTYLSVFVGSFSLEGAELLCGDTLSPALPLTFSPVQVLDGIASLLDKSLLHRETGMYGGPRYVMLETVREYGLERIGVSGQEAVLRRQQAGCCLRLINHVEQTGLDPFGVQLRRLIDDDIHNVRAALVWATEYDVEVALLLAAALMNWLSGRGPLAEGRLLIERILALPGASAHTIPRAKFLYDAGRLMRLDHERDQAKAYVEESLALSQELRCHKGEAEALRELGRLHGNSDPVATQHCFETALVIYRALSDPGGIAFVTALMAQLATDQSDIPQARALAEESLTVAQQAGFPNPWAVMALGFIGYYVDGDLDEARSMLEQSLAHMDSKGFKADVLATLGSIATRQGDFATAHVLLDEALVLKKELGTEQRIFYFHWAQLSQAEDDLTQAVQLSRASLAVLRVPPDGRTQFLLHLTALATALNQYELAAQLLGVIISVDEVDLLVWRLLGEDYRRLADAARAHLGADRFDTAWTQGRASTFEAQAELAVSALEATLRGQDQPTSA